MHDLTNEELEKIYNLLSRAYNDLCKIKKILKGSEDNGKRTEPKANKG